MLNQYPLASVMVVAKVLIHSQGDSEGALREAIDFFAPSMVFLISNKQSKKAGLVFKYLKEHNERLGRRVSDIEYSELIEIDDAFSENSIIQMIEAVKKAQNIAEENAKGRTLQFYSGIAGGTKLMVVGAALAAMNNNLSSYYVSEEQLDRKGEVFEIGFMNDLMRSISFFRDGHYQSKKNLVYLNEVVRRESEGLPIIAREMALTLTFTDKAIRNAMRILKNHGLVDFERNEDGTEKKPQVYSSTMLGRYVLTMFGAQDLKDEGE